MIDLHIHSNYSDGKLGIDDLAAKIIAADVRYCSLTDHDSVCGLKEMETIMKDNAINFINGVEFSVLYKQQEIHILAYDFKVEKIGMLLDERDKIVNKKRVEELDTAVNLFRKIGFKVSDDLILDDKKTVGLLVALDVFNNKDNHRLMIQHHGYLPSEKEFYDSYQAPGQPCHVLKSGINVDWLLSKLQDIDCDKILAHPFVPVSFLVKQLLMRDIDNLIGLGLDGIEVYHDRNTNDQIELLRKYAVEKNLLFTGGSDHHGAEKDTAIGYYSDEKKVPSFKLTNYRSQYV